MTVAAFGGSRAAGLHGRERRADSWFTRSCCLEEGSGSSAQFPACAAAVRDGELDRHRYEAALNDLLGDLPMWSLCLYDRRITPATVLADVSG
jgi:hypothetical protein